MLASPTVLVDTSRTAGAESRELRSRAEGAGARRQEALFRGPSDPGNFSVDGEKPRYRFRRPAAETALGCDQEAFQKLLRRRQPPSGSAYPIRIVDEPERNARLRPQGEPAQR